MSVLEVVDESGETFPAQWPSGPLLELLERHGAPLGLSGAGYARLTGVVSERTITRWRAGTPVSTVLADRVACALGVHPSFIWPDWI